METNTNIIEVAKAYGLGSKAHHRAETCESCEGAGYVGRDQNECAGCGGTGGVVSRCDGVTVRVSPFLTVADGACIPETFERLADGLRGDAHDANQAGHRDARNALLLAADAVEHLAGAANEACARLEREAQMTSTGAAAMRSALKLEQRMREQDAETIGSLHAQLARLQQQYGELNDHCRQLTEENDRLRERPVSLAAVHGDAARVAS